MPPQQSFKGEAALSKRTEQELRRLRGEISCAECRRLKMRCDKMIPCSSCTKRGCTSICPNGTLLSGQGARLLLQDTDKLNRKLTEMSERIRQLEDALQIACTGTSDVRHPLLDEELLSIKRATETKAEEAHEEDDTEVVDKETMDAFAALSMSEGADGTHFMIFASLQDGVTNSTKSPPINPSLEIDISIQERLPRQINLLARAWPFKPVDVSERDLRAQIARSLPSWERATALCEAYFEMLSWHFRPVERAQVMEELMPMVYRWRWDSAQTSNPAIFPNAYKPSVTASSSSANTSLDLHDLALLLTVFATGSACDLTQNQLNEEAETYHHLARAALALRSIFDGTTLSTVQAVIGVAAYHVASARDGDLEAAWMHFSIGYCLAGSIGLQRDPGRMGLPPKIVQRRRSLFWEIFTLNIWQGISVGCPTVFCLHKIDCEFPEDTDSSISPEGEVRIGYWHWKRCFIKEVLAPIAEQISVSSLPKRYSAILEMDRRIRDFYLEHFRRPTVDALMGELKRMEKKQYETSIVYMEIVSLIIHRNFFAKAILDHPSNPLQSPFAPSVLSACRSATTILRLLREHYERQPRLLARMWLIWGHALSAAVIIASVVMRGPSLALVPNALTELESALSLFEKAKVHPAVQLGLPVLMRLYAKAKGAVLAQVDRVPSKDSTRSDVPSPPTEPDHRPCTQDYPFIDGASPLDTSQLENAARYPENLGSETIASPSTSARSTAQMGSYHEEAACSRSPPSAFFDIENSPAWNLYQNTGTNLSTDASSVPDDMFADSQQLFMDIDADSGVEDMWKLFVQDQGFENPDIFDRS